MPPRKMSARRKKSANATTSVDDHDSPTPEVESGAELAVVVKVVETETEVLNLLEVSNPNPNPNPNSNSNPAESDGVGFSSELVVTENCAVGDVNEASNEDGETDFGKDEVKEDLRLGSEDVDEGKKEIGVEMNEVGGVCLQNGDRDEMIEKEKEDLQESENVDEENQGAEVGKDEDGVVPIDGSHLETVAEISSAQEETTDVQVDDFKNLNDNTNSLVISAQESNISEVPCKNDAALAVEDNSNGDKMGTADIVSIQESGQDVGTKASCEINTTLAVEDDLKENGDDEENDDNSVGDEDPSLFVQDHIPDNKKDKDIEIYVGKLDKSTVEDDLVNVFQQFGELKSTRIVRNLTTNKSKGFAFIRFASADQAKRALSELKDGVEVKGKLVKISASQDNDTLYLGNICKTWKKEEVLQQLKDYGIEHIEMIRVPEDPKIDKKIKGFAFVEFSTHSDAVVAFQRLQKPDAVFGRDISAKVAFAQTPMHSSYENLSQVKQVYVEGLNKDWNEEKVREICEKYGEVVNVRFQSSRNKHKDFGLVTFTSSESALACVEGINNGGIGGEVKIKASIAKPQQKSRIQNQGFRGGHKVEMQSETSTFNKKGEISKETSEPKTLKMKGVSNSQQSKKKKKDSSKHKANIPQIKANIAKPQQKVSLKKQSTGGEFKAENQNKLPLMKKEGESSKEAELSKMKGKLNSQEGKRKRKASFEKNLNAPPGLRLGDQGTSKKPKSVGEGQNSKSASKAGNNKRKKASKYEVREYGGNRNANSKKPFKKQKGNMYGRERDNFRNPESDTHIRRGHDDYRNSMRYIDPYAPRYAASDAYYMVPESLPTRRHTDMEPHAGYIEPASAKQSRPYSGYVQPVVRSHNPHQTVYLEPASSNQSQSQLHSRYLDRSVLTQQSHSGYIQSAVVPETQPYRGYRQSDIVQIAHDPYDSGLARVFRHDGRGSGVTSYVGGPSLPASQVRDHTSYYQAGGSYGGGYSTRQAYY